MNFVVDKKYLNLCGVKLKNVKGFDTLDVIVMPFYPKLSCILSEGEANIGSDGIASYVFVLHYSIGKDFLRCEKSFTIDEVDLVRNELADNLLSAFSLTDSFLSKVRKARINGKKPWKIRHFPLPLKKAKAFKILGGKGNVFGVNGEVSEVTEVGETAVVDLRDLTFAKRNMDVCVKKAAQSFSFQNFDYYYQAWKAFYKKSSKSDAWNQYVDEIKTLQGLD